jgi:hypothetical protein
VLNQGQRQPGQPKTSSFNCDIPDFRKGTGLCPQLEELDMSHTLRNSALALALMFSADSLLASHAEAKTTFMQDCSAKWKAAKAANTVPAGTKWPDFMKTECAAGTDQAVTPPAPAPAKVVATKKTKPTTTPAPAPKAATADSGGSFMQKCSAAWKSMKDQGTTPGGLSWKDFVKQSCVVDASATVNTGADENATPPEPGDTDYSKIEVKKVDKNGKPFTTGQIAAHQRIKECAGEWHAAKSAGTLPGGEKWPHFWSTCNTRLKTQG